MAMKGPNESGTNSNTGEDEPSSSSTSKDA
ncbi:hypothetical protein CCACVL1_30256 [Corchorus capsularis]|uniref:Uncharacterized protein n=1 Tax=Corchorus capsularis TaxID=210143 RepID=A0A1R3FY74_COCAP|nr:hypothetical protein CCACVL1_30256 [Corchorus capsularis]